METLEKMLTLLIDVDLSDESKKGAANKMAQLLEQEVKNLPSLEKRVIIMAYSLDKSTQDTYESLALEYNMSMDDIMTAQNNALNLLRHSIFNN